MVTPYPATAERAQRIDARRFTNEPPTGFGQFEHLDIGCESAMPSLVDQPIAPRMAEIWPLSPEANLAERERRIRETPVVLSADEQLVADLESCLRRMPRELPLDAGALDDVIAAVRHFHGLTDAQVDEARAELAAERGAR